MSKIRFPRKLKKELKKKNLYELACLLCDYCYIKSANGIIDKIHEIIDSTKKFHDELCEIVEEYPEFGDFIIEFKKGLMSPAEAMKKYFDFPLTEDKIELTLEEFKDQKQVFKNQYIVE